jgi:hypothetical protein
MKQIQTMNQASNETNKRNNVTALKTNKPNISALNKRALKQDKEEYVRNLLQQKKITPRAEDLQWRRSKDNGIFKRMRADNLNPKLANARRLLAAMTRICTKPATAEEDHTSS